MWLKGQDGRSHRDQGDKGSGTLAAEHRQAAHIGSRRHFERNSRTRSGESQARKSYARASSRSTSPHSPAAMTSGKPGN